MLTILLAGAMVGSIVAISPRPAGAQEVMVRRGNLEQQGRVWVQQIVCGAPAHAGGQLVVRADFGSVTLQPGAHDRMECQVTLRVFRADQDMARRLAEGYDVTLRQAERGALVLAGRSSRGPRHQGLAVNYQIRVPMEFNADIETQGGEIDVGNLQGTLRGVTAGGDIRTGDISGPVHVETAGGDIQLGNIGDRLEARTAGGGIHVGDVKGDASLETSGGDIVAGRIAGGIRAETAGGDILLRGASGPVRAETAGGQIQVGQCENSIRVTTAGGSIRLQGALGPVEAETAGGGIDLYHIQNAVRALTAAGPIVAAFAPGGDAQGPSRLVTSVGDITIFLPPEFPVNIDAAIEEAFGHKIISDFPLRLEGAEESFRHRTERGEAALNGGGKMLQIRTTTGNIEIFKLNAERLQELKAKQEMLMKLWEQRSLPRPPKPPKLD